MPETASQSTSAVVLPNPGGADRRRSRASRVPSQQRDETRPADQPLRPARSRELDLEQTIHWRSRYWRPDGLACHMRPVRHARPHAVAAGAYAAGRGSRRDPALLSCRASAGPARRAPRRPSAHAHHRTPGTGPADGRPRPPALVGGPAQALELAPETLAGPALPAHGRDPWPGLLHDRRAVVDVAGRGNGSPDARLDRPQDLDDALAIRDEGLHPIAGTNLRRWLCRRSVHQDVAALAQPGRERACLHEAHRT